LRAPSAYRDIGERRRSWLKRPLRVWEISLPVSADLEADGRQGPVERRAEVRPRPSDVSWLRSALAASALGVYRIIDISDSGVGLLGDRELAPGMDLVLELMCKNGWTSVSARVIWSRCMTSRSFVWYDVGCRLESSMPTDIG
jgi:hypothetical protein